MKNKSNLRIIILALGMVFILSAVSNFNLINDQGNKERSIEIRDEFNLKKPRISGSYIESFIHIDGNWSDTATTYNWCNGDGSWSNPYIIENVTIEDGSGLGILIENTREFFEIKNCTVPNVEVGIKILNCTNAKILNTNIHNIHGLNGTDGNPSTNGGDGKEGVGIAINDCVNVTISLNNISSVFGGNGGTGGNAAVLGWNGGYGINTCLTYNNRPY